MSVRSTGVASCFIPAVWGLCDQVLQPLPLPSRLLALALLLMLFEQAHMAKVDLDQVAAVRPTLTGQKELTAFSRLLWVTIFGQLLGFYLAAVGYLGVGMLAIMASLLGFNLRANLRLQPSEAPPVQLAGPGTRLDVITIDLVALGLGLLWVRQMAQLWIAGLLLLLALGYAVAKLSAYATAWVKRPSASAVHVAYAAQQHPQPPQQNRQGQSS